MRMQGIFKKIHAFKYQENQKYKFQNSREVGRIIAMKYRDAKVSEMY